MLLVSIEVFGSYISVNKVGKTPLALCTVGLLIMIIPALLFDPSTWFHTYSSSTVMIGATLIALGTVISMRLFYYYDSVLGWIGGLLFWSAYLSVYLNNLGFPNRTRGLFEFW